MSVGVSLSVNKNSLEGLVMGKIKAGLLFCMFVCGVQFAYSDGSVQQVPTKRDIVYSGADTADNPRKLDLYLPSKAKQPFPMLVWFHGGA